MTHLSVNLFIYFSGRGESGLFVDSFRARYPQTPGTILVPLKCVAVGPPVTYSKGQALGNLFTNFTVKICSLCAVEAATFF